MEEVQQLQNSIYNLESELSRIESKIENLEKYRLDGWAKQLEAQRTRLNEVSDNLVIQRSRRTDRVEQTQRKFDQTHEALLRQVDRAGGGIDHTLDQLTNDANMLNSVKHFFQTLREKLVALNFS